ncbi:MAG: Obg family GTPase CgtA, partial [Firmicutes bacterium]|nr:Obg family GTPase CgtA [Bacillota bacterium]
FVLADIPGLIEGASEGMGLGHSFLRHIERTRLLAHVIDISGSEGRDPLADFELINNEIYSYDENLRNLPMIVIANKMDMPDAEENLARFKSKYGQEYEIIPMTTIIHEGVEDFIIKTAALLYDIPPVKAMEYTPYRLQQEEDDGFEIVKLADNVFEVVGGLVTQLSRKVDLDDFDSYRYFERVLKTRGVYRALREAGACDNDTVIIGEIEFEYLE